jgi:hypothetical protein
VNVDASNAAVVLAAYDENGNKIGENVLPPIRPGQKVIGLTSQLFSGLTGARFFGFSSDKPLIGFSVSRSEDGLRLDGLMANPRYILAPSDPVR